MSTSRSFQSMLNEYLPLDLLNNEWQKRDYVYSKVTKKDTWKGGTLVIPFEGQQATSVEFGQLAADTDVAQDDFIRGQIAVQPEVWSTMKFNHRDLMEHDGKIPESTFLRILPNRVNVMMDYFKMVASVNMLNGPHFAAATVDGTALGVLEVDRVDRFQLSQKVVLQDNNTAAATYYVIGVNTNGGSLLSGSVTLSATRGGAAADISAYTVAQAAKVYHPGALTGSFTSLESQLLSLANGGTTNLFGQVKTAYQFLQAVQIDGSAVSASNILQKIFDGYTRRMILGKGGAAPEVLMSFKHFGSCMKLIESSKGAFNVVPNSRKTSVYGWDTIEVGSVSGQMLKLVGIQEKSDSTIFYLDWDGISFYSNGGIKRRTAPDGKQYFELRATTGYSYVLDHCLFGDIVVEKPASQAIMYGIPAY